MTSAAVKSTKEYLVSFGVAYDSTARKEVKCNVSSPILYMSKSYYRKVDQ